MKIFLPIFFLTIVAFPASGQDKFPNTLFYDSSLGSPKADIQSIAWLAGHWRGEALGGVTEEVWTPALGGSMMCAFKLVVDGKVKFYELVTITQEDSTLLMRLKHFHPDLKGWEGQNETQDFRLVEVADDRVCFDGFTIRKLGNDEIDIYVVIKSGSEQKEMKFHYTKVAG